MSWLNFFRIDVRNPFMQVFVGVGLLQGVLFYLLFSKTFWDTELVQVAYDHWRAVAACFLFHATFSFFLAFHKNGPWRSAFVATLFGLLQVALWLLFFSLYDSKDVGGKVSYYFFAQNPVGFGALPTYYIHSLILCYVALPFLQIFAASGKLGFPYPELFHHSWNNAQITLTSYILTLLFFGVIFLCGGLLEILQVRMLSNVLIKEWFYLPAFFTVKAIGYAIARENEAITAAARKSTLAICRFLFPIMAVFTVVFCIALIPQGLEPLWKLHMGTPLLLSFVFLMVLFFNAVFQDGASDFSFRGILGSVQRFALILLPVLAGLSLYSLMQRVDQYGLTPQRFYWLLFVFFAGLYALVYMAAALRPAAKSGGWIMRGNVAVALLLLATVMLLQVPPLSPVALSAMDQKRLLVSGRIPPEKFDFHSLQWKMGHPGRQVLAQLEAAEGPNAELIRNKITAARSSSSPRYGQRPKVEVPEAELRNFPAYMIVKFEDSVFKDGVPGPLADYIIKQHRRVLESCQKRYACALLSIDIDRDGQKEALLIAENLRVYVYRLKPETGWEQSPFSGKAKIELGSEEERSALTGARNLKGLEDYLLVIKTVVPPPPALDDIELNKGARIIFNRW